MLAGIPQNPAKHNPAVNPVRAKARQELVLKRLLQLGKITTGAICRGRSPAAQDQRTACSSKCMPTMLPRWCARSSMRNTRARPTRSGFNVYTTLDKAEQNAAYDSVRRNVLAYDQRHGYRGPEGFIELPATRTSRTRPSTGSWPSIPNSDNLIAAVVTEVSSKRVRAEPASGDTLEIKGDGLAFRGPRPAAERQNGIGIRVGSVIRVSPRRQGPLVDQPDAGSRCRFRRPECRGWRLPRPGRRLRFLAPAVQPRHQRLAPAGVEHQALRLFGGAGKGLTRRPRRSNDAPLSLPGGDNGQAWEPQNDDGYDGPISLRRALARSKNVVAVRCCGPSRRSTRATICSASASMPPSIRPT
jgi:penicillin-binding protein 1A